MMSFLGRCPDLTKSARVSLVTLDLIQLHVMDALGALGGIVKDEAYEKTKMSGWIISRQMFTDLNTQMAAYERGLMTYG